MNQILGGSLDSLQGPWCVYVYVCVCERFSHTRWVSRLFNLKLHQLKSLAEIAHLPSAPAVQR